MSDKIVRDVTYFTRLREANIARQREWDPEDKLSLSFRSNEVAGELGETLERAIDLVLLAVTGGRVANVAKKLDRERLGLRGSRATVADLAEELADMVITADNLAAAAGINLDEAIASKFNAVSEKLGLKTRLRVVRQ